MPRRPVGSRLPRQVMTMMLQPPLEGPEDDGSCRGVLCKSKCRETFADDGMSQPWASFPPAGIELEAFLRVESCEPIGR